MADRLVSNGVECSGPTTQRPANAEQGHLYYDTTIGNVVVQNDGSGTGTPTAGYHAAGGVCAETVTFTETTGAGTYTGSVSVPAGASILDIIVDGVALWTATTSASLKVGDVADDDGYFVATDLKATDLLAGESLSFSHAGGKGGAYLTGASNQVAPRYSASARTVSGIITTVGAAGTAGRTRMTVVYSLPRVKAATKV